MSWTGTISRLTVLGQRFPWLRRLVIFVGATAGMYATIHICEATLFLQYGWAVWWPMNAIVLALLLMAPRRNWGWIVGCFATGMLITEMASAVHAGEAITDVCGNVIEVLIGASALPRFRNLESWLLEPYLQVRFVVFALMLGPAASTLLVAGYLAKVNGIGFWDAALKWGVADSLGIAILTPLVLVLSKKETYAMFHWNSLGRTAGLLGLSAGASWAVFHQQQYPLMFAIYPVLLLIAIRLGFSGSVIAVNMLALIATQATLHGHGPIQLLAGKAEQYRVLTLQMFLTLSMLMGFPVGVMLVERKRFENKLKLAYEQMEKLAAVDGLTGLANRRTFETAIDTEWRRAQRERHPIAVLMMDTDNFKAFNDMYGHLAGDDCLRAIARAIEALPGRPNDLVARYGGEEFVVLLPGTDASGMLEVAELLRDRVEKLALEHLGNAGGRVTVSIGCAASIPRDGMLPSAVIGAADRALYVAKQNGRNRVEIAAERVVPMQTVRPAGVLTRR